MSSVTPKTKIIDNWPIDQTRAANAFCKIKNEEWVTKKNKEPFSKLSHCLCNLKHSLAAVFYGTPSGTCEQNTLAVVLSDHEIDVVRT